MQPAELDWSRFDFHRVVALPAEYEVFDFTAGYDAARALRSPWGIGRYDEKRPGMYTTELFGGVRDVHMGIDVGAPVGTPVHAFWEGEVFKLGYNAAPGDYGYTLVTRHELDGRVLYALFGHLGARSLVGRAEGQRVARGEVLGYVGDRHENGGWNPHLHFQLSWEAPERADMPGVVTEADRAAARQRFPDPRCVLGKLY
jgi:murein DD-endopeptidase MepM/ murein hydrolase activator NlpD